MIMIGFAQVRAPAPRFTTAVAVAGAGKGEESDQEGDGDSSDVVGAVVGALAGGCLIIALAVAIFKFKQQRANDSVLAGMRSHTLKRRASTQSSTMTNTVVLGGRTPPSLSGLQHNSGPMDTATKHNPSFEADTPQFKLDRAKVQAADIKTADTLC